MKNVLITGVAGFIGSHLVGHILSKKRPVTVILRPDSDTSRLKNFKSNVTHALWGVYTLVLGIIAKILFWK